MKKKLIIGALALTSTFALYSFDDGNQSQTDGRPMFGSDITAWSPCYYTGTIYADGTRETAQDVRTTTYVFWIGFQSYETIYNDCQVYP